MTILTFQLKNKNQERKENKIKLLVKMKFNIKKVQVEIKTFLRVFQKQK